MLFQHHSSPSVLLVSRQLEAASIITECFRILRYLLAEQSTWKEILVVNAVIRPICEYVFLGGVAVEVQEH